MRKSLPQIFKEVQEAEGTEAKLDIIRKNYSVSAAAVMSLLFNPAIKLNLPKGIPSDFEFNDAPSISLERAIRSFPTFVSSPESSTRLQIGWLRLMKNLSKEEALFAIALKDRDFETGLTQADVHAAFPTLIPAPGAEPVKAAEVKTEAVAPVSSTTEVDKPSGNKPAKVADEFPDYDEVATPAKPETISDEDAEALALAQVEAAAKAEIEAAEAAEAEKATAKPKAKKPAKAKAPKKDADAE